MSELFNINLSATFKRKVLIAFELSVALLLLVGVITWNNAKQSSSSIASFEHNRQLEQAFDILRSNLDREENRQWIALLEKDQNLLQQSDIELQENNSNQDTLNSLTKNDQIQKQNLEKINALVAMRKETFISSRKLLVMGDVNSAKSNFSKDLKLSQEIGKLITEAKNSLRTTTQQQQEYEVTSEKRIATIIIFLLILIGLISSWIQRSIHRRLLEEHTVYEQKQPLLKNGVLQDAIFNSRNFSSIATDAQGVIQIFNVGAERMLGYKASDVVDKISPADISDPQEIILRALALSEEMQTSITPGFEALVYKACRGIEDIYDLTYVRKDGSRFPANVSVTALRDAEQKIIGYLLIGIDNSARKQVEATQAITDQRLRDLQFYTRSLIESNIDALMTTDPNGVISNVNQQMEGLTGCSREELIGSPCKNYFTEPEQANAAITRVLQEGKITNFELTVLAKDGKETLVSYNATTFYDHERNLQGVFAAARDVTERKQTELALQETNMELNFAIATAEKANLAKSEFLSSMSHELRTPLNAILGFAQLMETEDPPPSSQQKQSIDQILQAGWYLLRLINEILDLSMIESGRVTICNEAMSLSEVLKDCQLMIEPQALKRHITMQFPSVNDSLYVYADQTRVKQVMINLLSNAIKYNSEHGSVKVECLRIGQFKIRVNVTDTGLGLNQRQLLQLFQPFNRLGQESSNKEGTGIGLVVTKQLMELMDGEIGVESQVGIGSTFWIELTTSDAPQLLTFKEHQIETSQIIEQNNKSDLVQRTLLYVEDNPANLALVTQLIARRPDLRMMSATDGHLGLKMARAYQPDVILMDINLPGMNGFEVLAILQNDHLTSHIPVIALSANAMQRDIQRGMQAGFHHYLTKPIKVDEFMNKLTSAIDYIALQNEGKKPSHSLYSHLHDSITESQ
jgi:PAS domain S-box-containing protein